MPANFVLLERIELNASAASVTFANIPQTGYTDLKVVWSARSARTGSNTDDMVIGFNGVNTNLSGRYVWGTGSAAQSGTDTQVLVGEYPTSTATANTFSNCEVYIPNYTGSTNKSFSADTVGENNGTLAYAALTAGLWSQTAAITSVTLKTGSGSNLDANSTFSLYGLAALGTTPAIAPKASGGNIIDYDGTYFIHTFLTSGTFTPSTSLTCDYLVVAGGGGGTYAGGGAGGLRSTVTATGGGGSLESAVTLASAVAYAITIGGGGAGSSTTAANGVASSIIGTAVSISSVGGGGSTVSGITTGATGGSGGGGGGAGGNGGAGTANQGRAGGNGNTGSSGGGGGASVAAAAASVNNGGAGGAGVATSISGTSVTYAGGGGGSGGSTNGAGGAGGGGAASGTTGSNGTTNLGGGAGGGGGGTGSNGGSGVVIIRYLA
jgi:hypothetical protein